MPEFDYAKLIQLDAESLCEQGIEDAYSEITLSLKKWVEPQELLRVETDNDDYSIRINNQVYPVYIHGPMDVTACWENATYVFFHIVNEQLNGTDIKFYALYSGNDLAGGFLTTAEVKQLKSANPKNKYEWPYLPTYKTEQTK